MKNFLYFLVILLTINIGLMAFAILPTRADWEGPPNNPPENNRPRPIDVSATAQTKEGSLTVESNFTIGQAGLNPNFYLGGGSQWVINGANGAVDGLFLNFGFNADTILSLKRSNVAPDIYSGVGILVQDPDFPLHIVDNEDTAIINIDDEEGNLWTGFRMARSGNERWFIGINDADNDLIFRKAGADPDVMVIDTDGNVGIGTLDPLSKLHVEGTVRGNFLPSDGNPCAANQVLKRNEANDAWICSAADEYEAAIYWQQTGDNIHTVDTVEDVGIGIAVPEAKLHVLANNNYAAVIIDQQRNFDILQLIEDDGTTAFVVDRFGKVGIGTDNPNRALHIKDITGNYAEIDIESNDGEHWAIYQQREDPGSRDLRFWNTTAGNLLVLEDEGNVGIGIDDPDSTLHVDGTIRGNFVDYAGNTCVDNQILKYDSGNSRWECDDDSSGDEGIWSRGAGSEIYYNDDANANVGIGTNDPENILHIRRDVDEAIRIDLENRNVGGTAGANLRFRGPNGATVASNYYSNSNNTYKIATYVAGSEMFFSTVNVERVRIDDAGKVGIGTDEPNRLLHIKKTTGDNAEIDIESTDGNHWAIYQDRGTADLRFWNTGANNLLVLDSTDPGKVGIGTITPSEKLDVAGNIQVQGTNLKATDADNFYIDANGNIQMRIDADNNSVNTFKINTGDNTTVFEINEAGEVKGNFVDADGVDCAVGEILKKDADGDWACLESGGGYEYPTEVKETNAINNADFSGYGGSSNGFNGLKRFAETNACASADGWHVCHGWELNYLFSNEVATDACSTEADDDAGCGATCCAGWIFPVISEINSTSGDCGGYSDSTSGYLYNSIWYRAQYGIAGCDEELPVICCR